MTTTPRKTNLPATGIVSESRANFENAYADNFKRQMLGMIARIVGQILEQNGFESVNRDGSYVLIDNGDADAEE
jgi:hypothetical protein